MSNAGYDDGLPASVLREITYLTELSTHKHKHPNINEIIKSQVKNNVTTILTKHLQ